MSPAIQAEDARDLVADVAVDEDTVRFIFIAESGAGELFSLPLVADGEGDGAVETQLLAEYLAVVSRRTGRTREALVRDLVRQLNDVEGDA
jgi:hypothetical protein